MNEPAFAELAKRLRRGLKHTASFYPVDLHCHTPLSPCYGTKDGESQPDIQATPMDVAVAACTKGIFVLAVVDHHRCENAQPVAAAAREIRLSGQDLYANNNLVVLPGMEIAVEENARTVHVLAVFPEDTPLPQIERVLDDTGIDTHPDRRTHSSRVTTKRLVEIVSHIRARGGLAILAHVNSTNGYRGEMRDIGRDDQEILDAIGQLGVNAVEVSRREDQPHFTVSGRQLPCLIGSDAHYLRDIGGKHYVTRVKMTDPSFLDLHRALEDPETRIRFQEPSLLGAKRIHGIALDGGFLDGQTIPFASNLNCLVGGRGTGKSTLIEAIRYLFEHRVPPDRQTEVDSLRDEVLTGSTATLLFADQFGEQYVLQRTYGDAHTKIMTLDGVERTDVDLSLSQNLRLSIYGWSEIEGIATDAAQQLDLVDSFIPDTSQLKRAEQAALDELQANARDIETALQTISREASLVGNLSELSQELKKLGEKQTTEEQRKALADSEADLIQSIEAAFADIRLQVENVDIVGALQAIRGKVEAAVSRESLLAPDVFKAISTSIAKATADEAPVQVAKSQLLAEVEKLREQAIASTTDVARMHKDIAEQFARLLARLDQPEAKQLAARREQLRQEITRREQAQARKAEAEGQLAQLRARRQRILGDVDAARTALYEVRHRHIAEIAAQLPRGRAGVDITITVTRQGNHDPFITVLTDKLVGLRRHWRERGYPLIIAEHFTPVEFAAVLRSSDSAQLRQAGFDTDEAADILRHFDGKEIDLMELEACPTTDRPHILFDVEGQKRPIEKLSPGQRCTALLPIILLETDTPLIIDQPEDNLDNQFIFDLVVHTMRRLKERRQIIVATHNPNIPVSGDAENILVFRPELDKGKLSRNGSIDYPPIIADVESIMEGGREAFMVRALKYGIPPPR